MLPIRGEVDGIRGGSVKPLTRFILCGLGAAALAAAAACDNTTSPYSTGGQNQGHYSPPERSDAPPKETIFGTGGLFGDHSKEEGSVNGGGIGVNAYLWRATLDTVSFLPLASADPFGGVIITDWYQPPESPNERLKLTVFILGRQLVADGIRVAVFRQTRDESGNWVDAKVDAKTAIQMEDAILAKARELRRSGSDNSG